MNRVNELLSRKKEVQTEVNKFIIYLINNYPFKTSKTVQEEINEFIAKYPDEQEKRYIKDELFGYQLKLKVIQLVIGDILKLQK